MLSLCVESVYRIYAIQNVLPLLRQDCQRGNEDLQCLSNSVSPFLRVNDSLTPLQFQSVDTP